MSRVRLGYLLVLIGVTCFSLNAGVSRLLLDNGLQAWTLTQLREICAAILLLALILLTGRRRRMAVPRQDWPVMAVYGVAGLALSQWLYLEAVARIPIGLAVLIGYLAPLWVALWARLVRKQQVKPLLWPALAITIVGLAIVAGVEFAQLDPIGLLAAFLCGMCFGLYFLVGERLVAAHDPFVVSFWGFTLAALFMSAMAVFLPDVLPAWQVDYNLEVIFPAALGGEALPVWPLLIWLVLLGTVAPFVSETVALQWVPATLVSVLAMLEPVGAAAIGWWWFGQEVNAFQAFGAALVLAGIIMALLSRAEHPTPAPIE